MAKDNAWKTIAEVYRNREHNLIQRLQVQLDSSQEDNLGVIEFILNDHLKSTGRNPDTPVIIPELFAPVDEARSELLALLGANGEPQGAHSGPVQVRTRKVRSDKGKPRGKRKVTV